MDVLKHRDDINIDNVFLAYELADEAHGGNVRESGEPYIQHPLHTAMLLAKLRMDEDTIISGLLHDVVEDSGVSLDTIRETFGPDVHHIVSGVTKLGLLKYRGVERYVENLRRMFVAMAKDIRVIIVKFADRIHNLQTLDSLPEEKRRRIALESLEIYAPIANRLGIGTLKGMLEDLAFQHIDPENYQWVKQQMDTLVESRQEHLDKMISETKQILESANIPYRSVHGRIKRVYSLYQKLLSKNKNFTEIHDLIAVRVVVENIHDCYAALGILHERWKPLKGQIKDYIAVPKPNGYQSLHTTIFCDDGTRIEFQVRTEKMHYEAEYGIAAHWNYIESGKPQRGSAISKHKIEWLNHLLELHEEVEDGEEFLESVKLDIFSNRIFVFTPKGDVIDLPEAATPIDFAYAVHTSIGNHCVGSKVNDAIAPLDRKLRSGDVVEILTDKRRSAPNEDWLRFARARSTKEHIRQALNSGSANIKTMHPVSKKARPVTH